MRVSALQRVSWNHHAPGKDPPTCSDSIPLQRILTALHVAAKEGRADACRMLLRAGADCLEEMTVRERENRI